MNSPFISFSYLSSFFKKIKSYHFLLLKSRFFKLFFASFLAISLLFTVAGCGSSSDNTNSPSNNASLPLVSVMLDWTPNTNHVGLYVAKKLGYYQQEGIRLDILPASQAGAETAVQTGVADIGFTTLSNVIAVDSKGSQLEYIFDLTQKPIARWCALASNKAIQSPKDFDNKTFVTFGSAEQTAVLKRMIQDDGGTGKFSSITVGTSTYRALTSGKGDFAGFYETWEGVESRLHPPALKCFNAANYGVPGNPDQLGYAVKKSWEAQNSSLIQKFVNATARGYAYSLAHPEQAASILVEEAKIAHISPELARDSMKLIASQNLWGDTARIAEAWKKTENDTTVKASQLAGIGKLNIKQGQEFIDFLSQAHIYSPPGKPKITPQVTQDATNKYVDSTSG